MSKIHKTIHIWRLFSKYFTEFIIIYHFLSKIAKNKNKNFNKKSWKFYLRIFLPFHSHHKWIEAHLFDVTSIKLKLPIYQGKTQQSKTLESEECVFFLSFDMTTIVWFVDYHHSFFFSMNFTSFSMIKNLTCWNICPISIVRWIDQVF